MITFFLGFGEVTKHLYFLNKANDARLEFFMQGANWSGIVYPTLFLLSPPIFPEMSFVPIIIVVYAFVLFWLAPDRSQKASKLALVFSFVVGYGIPLAFIASFADLPGFRIPPVIGQSPLQTLLTLIALVGFMAGLLRLSKDVFGLTLSAFTRNIWNRQLYSNQTACLFLLLSMSLFVCTVLTIAWFILFIFPEAAGSAGSPVNALRADYAARLALAGVAVAVLSVLAVFLTIFRPTKLRHVMDAAEDVNEMAMPATSGTATSRRAAAFLTYSHLVLKSSRLGVSWISGLAAALVVFQAVESFMQTGGAFFAMTLITMSGFLINDIYDAEKDRRAVRIGRLPLGTFRQSPLAV
jgi:hypothetical protein